MDRLQRVADCEPDSAISTINSVNRPGSGVIGMSMRMRSELRGNCVSHECHADLSDCQVSHLCSALHLFNASE